MTMRLQDQTITGSKPRNFVTLDLLRGIAALSVVQVHTAPLFGLPSSLANHSLSVDFFLMLSGFMMTYVYQERLDGGWSTAQFLRSRILRLYPLYFAGTAMGMLFAPFWVHYGRLRTSSVDLVILAVLGSFFLPAPPLPLLPTASSAIYPFNFPAWSLFYQLVANAIHGLTLRRRSLVFLCAIVLIFGILFLSITVHGRSDYGPERTDYLIALCRVFFGYPLGVILYRIWSTGRFQLRLHPLMVAACMLGVMALPVPSAWHAAYIWFAILLLLPLVILAGANSRRVGRLLPMFKWVGGLSFPLYILHVPIFQFCGQAWKILFRQRAEEGAPWSGLVYLLILVPTALVLGKLYDPEARKLLHLHFFPAASRFLRPERRRL